MTISAHSQRSLAALALVAGATGALTVQDAHAFGYMRVAITVEQARSGGVRQGGVAKHNHTSAQQQAPFYKTPGKLIKPARKCPGAHLPGQSCRKL